jgi:hypothetical protein
MDMNEIRPKEHVGFITSDTSTAQFSFFVTPLDKIGVETDEYVMVDHPFLGETCPLLAVVKEIKNYVEVVGTTVSERSIRTVSVCNIVGYVDLTDSQIRTLHGLSVPPNPGSKVYLPYYEFLEDVFIRDPYGRRFEPALHLGKLRSHATTKQGESKPLNFHLDASEITRHHILIAGMSGTGKTHTATVIIEELANKISVPIVIFDSFGEYTTIGIADKSIKEMVSQGIVPNNYPFGYSVLICAVHPDEVMGTLERWRVAYGKDSNYSVKPIPDQWTSSLDKKTSSEIKSRLSEDMKLNQVTIINSKGLRLAERQILFTGCIKALWSCRVEQMVEPFVLVVEEDKALENEMLKMIASEGRRTGVSMCLLSQHPAEIDDLVTSQMGTYILGRTTGGRDLECLQNLAGENASLLPQLRTGEWIVNGMTLVQPARLLVRDRYSLRV